MKQRDLIKKLQNAGFVLKDMAAAMMSMSEARRGKKSRDIRKSMNGWQRPSCGGEGFKQVGGMRNERGLSDLLYKN